eukprot:2327755-Rhodomonas_salina.2
MALLPPSLSTPPLSERLFSNSLSLSTLQPMPSVTSTWFVLGRRAARRETLTLWNQGSGSSGSRR